MPSTYTSNLGLEKPATGEQAGVWGDTANNSYDFIDQATDGDLTIPLSASSYNLNTLQGAASQGRNKVIVFTGALTQDATVQISPNTAQKIYFCQNSTTGGFGIIFQQGTGATFRLQMGYSAMIYCDGLGNAASVNGALYNPQFGSVIVTAGLTVNGPANFTQPMSFVTDTTFQGNTTFTGPATAQILTLNVGPANAPYDIYYRSPAGPLQALPIGGVGQVLQVNGAGQPSWATVALALGASVTGSIPYGVYFSDPANHLSQNGNFNINPGVGLGLGLLPGHTLHLGGNFQAQIWLDCTNSAAQSRQLTWASNNLPRWNLNSRPEPETGNNAGSNLAFDSYTDAGTYLATAISFFRNNNAVTVGAYGDTGAQFGVVNGTPSRVAMIVRGAGGQAQPLQMWQNSAGQVVAQIDQNGNLFLASGGFLSLQQPSGRLDLWGTVPGNPLGTIHIGQEPGGPVSTLRSSIAMETASGATDPMPPGCIRMYYRSGCFVIQFYYNGQNFFLYVNLVGQQGGQATWSISPFPI